MSDLLTSLSNRSLLSFPIVISSFDFKELDAPSKKFRRGILFDKIPDNWIELAKDYSAWSVNLAFKEVSLDMIQSAHLHGLKVLAYTVNEPSDITTLELLGVDGVFSDYPDRILIATLPKG